MTPAPRSMRPLRALWPVLVGVVVVVVLAILPLLNLSIPGVLPGPTYTPGTLALLSLCMVYAALALSYNMLLGTSGLLSFGHALYFGVGAYGLGLALEYAQVPLWPGILIAVLGGLVIAVVTGAISLRVTGIPFAMVTLAFAQAVSLLVRRNAQITGGEEGLNLPTAHVPDSLVGVVHTRNLYWVVLGMVVIVYLIALWIDRSRLGHLAEATRENELRVRVLGLSPYLAKLIVFAAAAVGASLAGVAYMLLQTGTQPQAVSADLTITILVMVVLGGVGFRWGAVVGGVVYTLLDQRLTVLARSEAIGSLPDVPAGAAVRAAVPAGRTVHHRGHVPARRDRRHPRRHGAPSCPPSGRGRHARRGAGAVPR
ncbi:branched-chain amino acid ABC transporter permease [Microbacterium elymi]|uniref:branched-chain amino acid ABC transporter permease n=1 Tax=Microbacterium elymi TaxID=2909587 RepID=UPI003F496FA9